MLKGPQTRILFLCCFLICFSAVGQTVVNTTGNTVTKNGFTFEYSVGEVAVTTLIGTQNELTQGVLQPNLKIINPGCEIVNGSLLSFENPTGDKVRIVGRYDWISDYEIYAADGKLVRLARFQNNYIDLQYLPSAVYFIRLLPGCDGKYRTLKIVKQ